MVAARQHHPWILTGPWYRWPSPGVPASGRAAAPVLQKYASPKFIDEFLREPQRSLKWRPEDHVHYVKGGWGSGLAFSTLRKLFLDTHARHYLVACELHCDAPGFPSVGRDQVCESGFVIRRRTIAVPDGARAEVQAALDGVSKAQAKLNLALAAGAPGKPPGFAEAIALATKGEQANLAYQLELAQAALSKIVDKHQLVTRVQGWIPDEDHKHLGDWQDVDETPGTGTEEQVYRLFPLVAPPADTRHSARGRTVYFGAVPTGSADTDARGVPRFDERTVYEVRCFVRRHDRCCPKKSQAPCCKGELVWSRPTERFQLAAHFDLDGTNHRPVTIQLPDLDQLRLHAGALAGVRMVAPQSLEFGLNNDGEPTGGQVTDQAICTFSIPLITIVASFVFRLFLPIVVITFGLWWMLKLKFCIPPSLSLDADLVAEIDASLEIEISVELEAKIDAAIQANVSPPELASQLVALSARNKARLLLHMATDFSGKSPPGPLSATPPSLRADLEYHERLEVPV